MHNMSETILPRIRTRDKQRTLQKKVKLQIQIRYHQLSPTMLHMQRGAIMKLSQLPHLHGKHIRGRNRKKNPRRQLHEKTIRLRHGATMRRSV